MKTRVSDSQFWPPQHHSLHSKCREHLQINLIKSSRKHLCRTHNRIIKFYVLCHTHIYTTRNGQSPCITFVAHTMFSSRFDRFSPVLFDSVSFVFIQRFFFISLFLCDDCTANFVSFFFIFIQVDNFEICYMDSIWIINKLYSVRVALELNRNYIEDISNGIRWIRLLFSGFGSRAWRVETTNIQRKLNRIWSGTFVLYWNLR